MKTIALRKWTAVCLSALAVNAVANARADQPAVADKQERTWTGTVGLVDGNEHILKVNGLFLHKAFNLGHTCSYVFLDSGSDTIGGLRPGEKVMVSYRKVDGVLIADRVEQQPMLFAGTVKQIDWQKHTLLVRRHGVERTFQIDNGCKIELRDNRSGTLADVQPGNRVTVTYETPEGGTVARRIAQTSQSFTGELTAMDLNDRTVKAKAMIGGKKFILASDCAVVVNGKIDSNLGALRLGDTLEFDYIDVNGINIVNRIASAPSTASAGSSRESASATPAMAYPGY